MTCLLCKGKKPWTEKSFIQGLVTDWHDLPDDGTYEDCDKCWEAMQRVQAYGDGQILIRDKKWNWRVIRHAD